MQILRNMNNIFSLTKAWCCITQPCINIRSQHPRSFVSRIQIPLKGIRWNLREFFLLIKYSTCWHLLRRYSVSRYYILFLDIEVIVSCIFRPYMDKYLRSRDYTHDDDNYHIGLYSKTLLSTEATCLNSLLIWGFKFSLSRFTYI